MRAWLVIAGVFCLTLGRAAWGQLDTVDLRVETQDVGLAGKVRLGMWTPVRLTLHNHSAQPRRIICEWALPDTDGDIVLARRIIVANSQRTERVWLYGYPPADLASNALTTVRLVETTANGDLNTVGGRLLAQQSLALRPDNRVESKRTVIGILGSTGGGALGLQPYTEGRTQHESCDLITGLTPADLPDRWYGLTLLDALIWLPGAGDPGSLGEEAQQALREWVRRGGHLIVVLPAEGEPWSASPLTDLLPARQSNLPGAPQVIRTIEGVRGTSLPTWLGQPNIERPGSFRYRWFDLSGLPPGQATALLEDREGHPTVIAGQFGVGRVTMIGIDISSTALASLRLPSSLTQSVNPVRMTLWPTVMGWRGAVFSEAFVNDAEKTRTLIGRNQWNFNDQAYFIPAMLAMRGETGPALALAVLVFLLYWVLAGPVCYAVLKKRGRLRQAWLGFGAVVLAFTLISWSGAWALRTDYTRLAHYTVLDVDAGSGLVHGHAWLSLLVPEHARVAVNLGAAQELEQGDVLAAPGVGESDDKVRFFDQQRYVVSGQAPHRLDVPMRATAKQFEADFLGLGDKAGDWVWPQGRLQIIRGKLTGELVHQLPGELRDTLLVWCPGDGREPVVRRIQGSWQPGEKLVISGTVDWMPLALPPRQPYSDKNVDRQWAGFLAGIGGVMDDQNQQNQAGLSDDTRTRMIERLTFFSTLPSPDFWRGDDSWRSPLAFDRSTARTIDLTRLLPLRRLLVISHLRLDGKAAAPIPLTVNGQTPPAAGWTTIRWISRVD